MSMTFLERIAGRYLSESEAFGKPTRSEYRDGRVGFESEADDGKATMVVLSPPGLCHGHDTEPCGSWLPSRGAGRLFLPIPRLLDLVKGAWPEAYEAVRAEAKRMGANIKGHR